MREILIKGWQLNIYQIFVAKDTAFEFNQILALVEQACFSIEMGFREKEAYSEEIQLAIEYQKLINQLND